MKPLVSIIIVNYHQPEATLELLENLSRVNTYPDVEVILIDNEVPFSKECEYGQYPGVRYLYNERNVGFAYANNQGSLIANGKYLFFLNNDTIIEDSTIDTLVGKLERDEELGGISPVIRYYDQPERIQYAGSTPIHPVTGRNEQRTRFQGSQTAYLHGAAMMVPSSVWIAVDGMSNDYFLYYEEIDFSQKVRSLGFRLEVTDQTEILHKASLSTGKNSPLRLYYLNRNRMHWMRRWSDIGALFSLYFLLVALIQLCTAPETGKIIMKAWIDGVSGITGKSVVNLDTRTKTPLTLKFT